MISPAFWWQAIKLALSQIRANLGRSLLTALGIIVGVASVTAVIAALGGLKDRVLTEFETFGANRLLVFPDRPDDAPRNLYPWKDVRLKIAEVDAIDATDVLLLGSDPLEAIYPAPLDQFERRLIGVYRRVQPVDTLLGLQRSREIAGMPFVALRTHAVPLYRLRLKRLLDFVLLLVALPVITVVVGLAALYVFVRAGRGVIYRQERVGRRGEVFEVLKFRTMIRDAEAATGATLATKNDPRVLAGMRWFRAARLDELPQLWNVAKGEMSLVGPRPERAEFVERFEELLPGYNRRHDMPPGITGLAQIRGQYQTDPGYKLGHDLQYIVNWSPVLDLMIMLETIVVMARRSAR